MRAKLGMVAIVAALALIGLVSQASAYHDGGVARCSGCHTMHNSAVSSTGVDGVMAKSFAAGVGSPGGTVGNGNQYLLIGATQSETCLNCHNKAATGSYGVSSIAAGVTVPAQMGPGGDFMWITKTFTWTSHGSPQTSAGQRHGHNINAPGFGYNTDPNIATSPGGSYSAANLHCSSCHDPHGRYRILDATGTIGTTGLPIAESGSYPGNNPTADAAVGVYRLLGGKSYSPKSLSGSHSFSSLVDPPAALAPNTYNKLNAGLDVRVAYGSGMSEWCANCHGGFHNEDVDTNFRHPAGNGAELGDIAATYDSYVKSGDLTGIPSTSYLSLVSFETGDTNTTDGRTAMGTLAVSDGSQKGGPSATSNVMCLTCHRAHASGWDSMARWNTTTTMIVENDSYVDADIAQGRNEAEATRAYYDIPATQFATFQRSLCNKCHAKD